MCGELGKPTSMKREEKKQYMQIGKWYGEELKDRIYELDRRIYGGKSETGNMVFS